MFGAAAGCLSVSLFIKNKEVFYISLLLTLLSSILMMFARRSTLKNPQTILLVFHIERKGLITLCIESNTMSFYGERENIFRV